MKVSTENVAKALIATSLATLALVLALSVIILTAMGVGYIPLAGPPMALVVLEIWGILFGIIGGTLLIFSGAA